MPRATGTNLSYLMNLLGVTGRELSRVVHVDPSLVSKWVNNRRKLALNSAHPARIADHLLTLCSTRQLETIRRLLEQGFPGIDLRVRENLAACLADWLAGSPAPVDGHAANGNTLSFKAFKGVDGRRQAVMYFLDMVLSARERLQLLLLSQEDMSWLLGDPSFLTRWAEKLSKVLEQGHKITIIHTVDRKLEELLPILEKWLALHMTGGVESYYYPKYADTSLKNTLFIIPGRLAVTSLIDERQADTSYTFLHQDQRMVKYYEGVFNAFFRESRTFLRRYGSDDLRELHETRLQAEARKGGVYHMGHLPGLDTLPRDVLPSAVAEGSAELPEVLKHSFRSGPCREIYSIRALSRAASGNEFTQHGAVLHGMNPLELRREYLLQRLASLLHRIQDEPNYELALVDGQLPAISRLYDVWVKENALATFVAPGDLERAPLVFSAEEITTVNAFYKYCEGVWQSIPRVNRDRERVAAKLRRILADADG